MAWLCWLSKSSATIRSAARCMHFTNRQRNKIKCVMWEDNGFVMYYKALAEEKFKWPKPADELLSLTGEQINWLLDGYDISLFKGHKKLQYDSLRIA